MGGVNNENYEPVNKNQNGIDFNQISETNQRNKEDHQILSEFPARDSNPTDTRKLINEKCTNERVILKMNNSNRTVSNDCNKLIDLCEEIYKSDSNKSHYKTRTNDIKNNFKQLIIFCEKIYKSDFISNYEKNSYSTQIDCKKLITLCEKMLKDEANVSNYKNDAQENGTNLIDLYKNIFDTIENISNNEMNISDTETDEKNTSGMQNCTTVVYNQEESHSHRHHFIITIQNLLNRNETEQLQIPNEDNKDRRKNNHFKTDENSVKANKTELYKSKRYYSPEVRYDSNKENFYATNVNVTKTDKIDLNMETNKHRNISEIKQIWQNKFQTKMNNSEVKKNKLYQFNIHINPKYRSDIKKIMIFENKIPSVEIELKNGANITYRIVKKSTNNSLPNKIGKEENVTSNKLNNSVNIFPNGIINENRNFTWKPIINKIEHITSKQMVRAIINSFQNISEKNNLFQNKIISHLIQFFFKENGTKISFQQHSNKKEDRDRITRAIRKRSINRGNPSAENVNHVKVYKESILREKPNLQNGKHDAKVYKRSINTTEEKPCLQNVNRAKLYKYLKLINVRVETTAPKSEFEGDAQNVKENFGELRRSQSKSGRKFGLGDCRKYFMLPLDYDYNQLIQD